MESRAPGRSHQEAGAPSWAAASRAAISRARRRMYHAMPPISATGSVDSKIVPARNARWLSSSRPERHTEHASAARGRSRASAASASEREPAQRAHR